MSTDDPIHYYHQPKFTSTPKPKSSLKTTPPLKSCLTNSTTSSSPSQHVIRQECHQNAAGKSKLINSSLSSSLLSSSSSSSTSSSSVSSLQHQQPHRQVKFSVIMMGDKVHQHHPQQQHHHHVTIVEETHEGGGQPTTPPPPPPPPHSSSGPTPQIMVQFAQGEDHAFRTKIDSSYEGWDNPFRPEGELSHEAEELLRLWKEGKLKNKPVGIGYDEADQSGQRQQTDEATSSTLPQNGVTGASTSSTTVVSVKRQQVPQASSAGRVQHVNLGSSDAGGAAKEAAPSTTAAGAVDASTVDAQKKKKNQGCCAIM